MIDLITLVKPKLTDWEVEQIVSHNNLQTNSSDGVVFYDNVGSKNLAQQQGVFIQIDKNNKLKLEVSLHKYYNEITDGKRVNSNLFTMSQARKAIKHLLSEKLIAFEGLRVMNYEIGLNIGLKKDCREYLDLMLWIGGDQRLIYVNPRYKDERSLTTVFHKHTRKHFKAYDKVFEMKDKKSKHTPKNQNILRIETSHRRVEKCTVANFFTPLKLKQAQAAFFDSWRTLQFERDVIAPAGTGRSKQLLCSDIVRNGCDEVVSQAKERLKNGVLTKRGYRTIREFVEREWNDFKTRITFKMSEEEEEYREIVNSYNVILENDIQQMFKTDN